MSSKCSYCNDELKEIPYDCSLCGNTHCTSHRLPEKHECKVLKSRKKYNKNYYSNKFNNSNNKKLPKYITTPPKRSMMFKFLQWFKK